MTGIDRKAAARAFRDRTSSRGVFALRCTSGGIWVGASKNLDAEEGRLRFFLRHGHHRDRRLQQAWADTGEDAFMFEVLERLDDDTAALILADVLRARAAHWAARLGAPILLP